jgi:RNA polymerase sigma factor (TIGR02999 family)
VPSSDDLTALRAHVQDGGGHAVDVLLPRVYEELQALAHRQLRGERAGHTLNTTALVHEAYLKLVDQNRTDWRSRAHFFALAATVMRRILINYAHQRNAQKRGGGQALLTFEGGMGSREANVEDLLAIDQALTALAERGERQAKVVEYQFFGGLTQEEIAEILGVSVPTVRRDWQFARAWLSRWLQEEAPPEVGPG